MDTAWMGFLLQPTQQNRGPAYVKATHAGQRSEVSHKAQQAETVKYARAMHEEKQHLGGASRSDADELSAVIDFGLGLWMQRERGAVAVVILASSSPSTSQRCRFHPYDLETSTRVYCIGLISAQNWQQTQRSSDGS